MIETPIHLDHRIVANFFAGPRSMLHGWVVSVIGASANTPVLGVLTWADVAVSAGFVAAALLSSAVAALLIRRASRRGDDSAGGRQWIAALGRPLHLAIWIGGVYCAGVALLAGLGVGDGLRTIADRLGEIGLIAALLWAAQRGTHVLDRRLETWAKRTPSQFDDVIAQLLGRSLRIGVPVLGVIIALPVLQLPREFSGLIAKSTSVLLIAALATILFRAVGIFEEAMLARFDIHSADNLQARAVYTQVHVIGRMIRVVIGVFAGASVLMLFDAVRHLGTSLLASAGIVGIVAGIAAQRTLANLFAGIQIALTQPMRQDDVVVVEGEWGRIEEITLSYVVIHIWDDRRLIVPISYFIEKPFQNWTRTSADLLGSVTVWVDYSFPVEQGRDALRRIIEANPLWDRRYWNLQVIDAGERSMQLRVLATAADSSKSWDLRCQIRERFIEYIQQAHPQSLPLVRARLGDDAERIA